MAEQMRGGPLCTRAAIVTALQALACNALLQQQLHLLPLPSAIAIHSSRLLQLMRLVCLLR
jgi:hypothetical protein